MALVQSDLDAIRSIIVDELSMIETHCPNFGNYMSDYVTYSYPQSLDPQLVTNFTDYMSDYVMYSYPQSLDSNLTVGITSYLSEYQTNGYPSSSSVDFTPILNDLGLVKQYTDSIESTLSQIKIKTDTIAPVDLTSIGTDISTISTNVSSIKTKTDSLQNCDLVPLGNVVTSLFNDLTSVKTKVDLNLDSKVSSIYPSLQSLLSDPSALSGLDYFNLDGNYGSFPNGSNVKLLPQNSLYVVEKSYLFQNDTNQFIVMYVLNDSFGKKMVAPHNYLELVV